MTIPNLLHPIRVKVQKLNTTTTVYDEDAAAPVRQGVRAMVYSLPAQVKWNVKDGSTPTSLGAEDEESGYLLFRKSECVAAGYFPTRRDRIIEIGGLTGLKLYIVSVKPMGHYPDQNGFTLWRCDFRDRAPAVENG